MTFVELAAQRRSTRKFSDKIIEKQTIDQILATTLTAPSSKNMRTTRIAVSEDKAVAELVSNMRSTGASFVKDAPLLFFIMGDDSQTDLWRENCSISATVMQFAIESLGLGSCWVQVFGRPHRDEDANGKTAEEYLKEHITKLPDHRIMCVIAAGYPETESKPRSAKDDSDKVFYL